MELWRLGSGGSAGARATGIGARGGDTVTGAGSGRSGDRDRGLGGAVVTGIGAGGETVTRVRFGWS